jgi:dihydrolipoamide dehydrogenase
MMNAAEYDVIIIGGGPVGENVADRAVQGGLTAVIVEAELVGGECSYWACMPTKALLRDAAALRAARRLPGAAAALTGTLDVDAVLRRRDHFASHWHDDGQVAWLNSAGIQLVRGHGRIDGTRAVTVTHADGSLTHLRARNAVVVATGTAASIPVIPGLAQAQPWTSREAVSTSQIPGSLAIIGGGVVGTELASAYTALGASVTLIARDTVLPHVEPFAAEHVINALREEGARILIGKAPTAVAREAQGGVRISLADGDIIEADELLVATGRKPNTSNIGLESVGVPAGTWLTVDETLRVVDETGDPVDGGWLYGVGDVNGRALLTHQGKYQARAAGDVIVARASGTPVDDLPWGRHAATADVRAVPQVIFTSPEIVAVGHTLATATAAGLRVRQVEYDLGAVAGAALHADGYSGRAAMLIDEDTDTLVGFTAVGPDVGELAHAATIAISAEVPIERLWHAVPAYPTMSEVWLRLLETAGRPPIASEASTRQLVTSDR